jgi:CBS domain-containing protein
MKVGEIGRREVVTVEPDAGVGEIAETMYHRKVGSVVVADEELVGIVTDRDLVIELLAEDSEVNQFDGEVALGDVTARDLMTTDPLTVGPDDEVAAAIAQMNDAITRRLPIVEDGRVAGIVTLDDLLIHLAGESRRLSADLEGLTDVIHAESPDR